MKSIQSFRDKIGLKSYSEVEKDIPVVQYKYFAYKDGKFIECSSAIAAKAISKNTEKVMTPESKKAHDDFWAARRELESKAFDGWYAELKAEHSDLTESQFNLIYSKAYDDGHSAGYDEVALHFSNLYDFVQQFVSLK